VLNNPIELQIGAILYVSPESYKSFHTRFRISVSIPPWLVTVNEGKNGNGDIHLSSCIKTLNSLISPYSSSSPSPTGDAGESSI